ncbi:group II intron reverse transcriptase/maturase [Dethiosulfatibacter aminovorans DSM 17477]|uniref:Group II intron reverse transcriptase/maturase n=1 Tax=Dethiosulfatibacter aminovorans DSM 17477 TaxID=1121476 RepID=A0A1M6I846_9FIRM|nr:reverse transcriptase domain-containing protein [Dethiosulfatibacter aminovorans]SHJ30622.1 group II intron reverse transcriptase/maturase [Dethiosulfatibacter aminovorans DSM 17477]
MLNELFGIQFNIAKADRTDGKVQNLAFYINIDTLRSAHKQMSRNKAYGVDKVNKDEYEANLEENLENLVRRMKSGSYKPKPSRRVYIPKDGKNKKRPLGISSYEDKLVEYVVAQILTQIYEPKFYDSSFGFRPNRNCHQAVKEVIEDVQFRKTNYVVEADIKSFFDTVDHEWMVKFLEHDIADRKFLGIIKRFLKVENMY